MISAKRENTILEKLKGASFAVLINFADLMYSKWENNVHIANKIIVNIYEG